MTQRPTLSALLAALALGLAPGSDAKSMLDCILPEDAVGVACDSPASLRVTLTNQCDQSLFVNLCIQVDAENWDCWREPALAPGAVLTRESCWSTRRYEYSACTGGVGECGFRN